MNNDKLVTFVCFFFIFTAIVGWLTSYDSTDNKEERERSGMKLYTDHLTGCQYLSGSNLFGASGLVPRFNEDGTQYCNKNE